MERELVKIVSNNPAHPHGYYTQFKDAMKPGDVIYQKPVINLSKAKINEKPVKKNKKVKK